MALSTPLTSTSSDLMSWLAGKATRQGTVRAGLVALFPHAARLVCSLAAPRPPGTLCRVTHPQRWSGGQEGECPHQPPWVGTGWLWGPPLARRGWAEDLLAWLSPPCAQGAGPPSGWGTCAPAPGRPSEHGTCRGAEVCTRPCTWAPAISQTCGAARGRAAGAQMAAGSALGLHLAGRWVSCPLV